MTAYQDIYWQSRDGLQLHARDYPAMGDSRPSLPIICLPGLTRNARDFEDVATWLAVQGKRTIAVDFRGRGLSDYDPKAKNYHPNTYAQDILALMQEQKIDRAHFIGTSLGGIVTATIAMRHGNRIGRVMLNDIGPEANPKGIKRIGAYAGGKASIANWSDADAYCRHVGADVYPAFSDADWRRFLRRTFRETAEGKPRFDYDPAVARTVSPLQVRLLSLFLWPRFTRLARKHPTLLLRGSLSDLLAPATVEKLKYKAPTLLTAEVANVGHAPTLDEADARTAIANFLGITENRT
ncbi:MULTISPECIES: alpha/beta fold hydrolase [Kordiimonas]|uniref:alpha/beta fold hydrolase n=1 Tax=Kordiimonas TaxID=288021 RepID=UPI00257C7E94|nr:alpha/beta hydrolase [Kordiimonas sp. UBA4487]